MDPRLSQGGAACAALLVMILSWQYGYQRVVRGYRHDREQVATIKENLSRFETMVASDGGKASWLAHNQQRLATLKVRFPQQDQLPHVLDTLIETLKASDLHLLNITQGKLEPVRDASGPVLVDGTPCFQFPVTVTVEGRYHAILATLERLTKETFPAVVNIEQVEFHVKEPTAAMLNATFMLSLHVIGPVSVTSPTALKVSDVARSTG